jgi:hypothetical protein
MELLSQFTDRKVSIGKGQQFEEEKSTKTTVFNKKFG